MTGLFSSIDVLLGKPLSEILPDMALTEQITKALLYRDNDMGKALNYILHFEQGDWEYLDTYDKNILLPKESFMEIYVEALSWVIKLEVN